MSSFLFLPFAPPPSHEKRKMLQQTGRAATNRWCLDSIVTVLRLDREAWSTAKRPRARKNQLPPPAVPTRMKLFPYDSTSAPPENSCLSPAHTQMKTTGGYLPTAQKRDPVGYFRVLGPALQRVCREQPGQAQRQGHGQRRVRGGFGVVGTCPCLVSSIGGRPSVDDGGLYHIRRANTMMILEHRSEAREKEQIYFV